MLEITYDEALLVSLGERIADGTPVEIRRNQGVIDAYLGTAGIPT